MDFSSWTIFFIKYLQSTLLLLFPPPPPDSTTACVCRFNDWTDETIQIAVVHPRRHFKSLTRFVFPSAVRTVNVYYVCNNRLVDELKRKTKIPYKAKNNVSKHSLFETFRIVENFWKKRRTRNLGCAHIVFPWSLTIMMTYRRNAKHTDRRIYAKRVVFCVVSRGQSRMYETGLSVHTGPVKTALRQSDTSETGEQKSRFEDRRAVTISKCARESPRVLFSKCSLVDVLSWRFGKWILSDTENHVSVAVKRGWGGYDFFVTNRKGCFRVQNVFKKYCDWGQYSTVTTTV